MIKILYNIHFEFDDSNYYRDTYKTEYTAKIDNYKNANEFITEFKNYLTNSDESVTFTKSNKYDLIYRDDKNGNSQAVGIILRFFDDYMDNGQGQYVKKYGNAWIEILGIIEKPRRILDILQDNLQNI